MQTNSFENPALHEIMANLSDILRPEQIDGASLEQGTLILVIKATPEQGTQAETWRQTIEKRLKDQTDLQNIQVILTMNRPAPTIPTRKKPQVIENLLPHVKHVIAVASGKGGVGKSTVAANIAVSLAKAGYKTGLIDADIYGPSVPTLFKLKGQPPFNDNKQLMPPEKFGVKIMSMGLLVEGDSPIIWRGPMIQSALVQFMRDVDWGELDFMIVDMPPGTGDAQLTMAQKIRLSGAVIVSTPQDIALIDARKAINMFKKTNVPILGLIENMSFHICDNCGHESHIFGHGGAAQEAEKNGIAFLGQIPLASDIRALSDSGETVALSQHTLAAIYHEIAEKIRTQFNDVDKP